MFDEKNIYVRQAEVKGSFKQNANGTVLLNELTVNASLKNYKKTLKKAFEISFDEIEAQNKKYDKKDKNDKGKK